MKRRIHCSDGPMVPCKDTDIQCHLLPITAIYCHIFGAVGIYMLQRPALRKRGTRHTALGIRRSGARRLYPRSDLGTGCSLASCAPRPLEGICPLLDRRSLRQRPSGLHTRCRHFSQLFRGSLGVRDEILLIWHATTFFLCIQKAPPASPVRLSFFWMVLVYHVRSQKSSNFFPNCRFF